MTSDCDWDHSSDDEAEIEMPTMMLPLPQLAGRMRSHTHSASMLCDCTSTVRVFLAARQSQSALQRLVSNADQVEIAPTSQKVKSALLHER